MRRHEPTDQATDGEAGRRQARARPSKRARAGNPQGERTGPVQYFREVQGEMKKVAWPPRAEIINSSIVVIIGVVVMTTLIFGFDYGSPVRAVDFIFELMADTFDPSNDAGVRPTAPRSLAMRRSPSRRSPQAIRRSTTDDGVATEADDATADADEDAVVDADEPAAEAGAELLDDAEVDRRSKRSRSRPSRARSTGPGAGTSCTPTPATRTR